MTFGNIEIVNHGGTLYARDLLSGSSMELTADQRDDLHRLAERWFWRLF